MSRLFRRQTRIHSACMPQGKRAKKRVIVLKAHQRRPQNLTGDKSESRKTLKLICYKRALQEGAIEERSWLVENEKQNTRYWKDKDSSKKFVMHFTRKLLLCCILVVLLSRCFAHRCGGPIFYGCKGAPAKKLRGLISRKIIFNRHQNQRMNALRRLWKKTQTWTTWREERSGVVYCIYMPSYWIIR